MQKCIPLMQISNLFLTVAFDEAKKRNKDYQGFFIGVSGLSPEEEQKFYIQDFSSRIRTLEARKEEMELIIETKEDSSKIGELKEQIEEKGLELTR